MANCTMEEAGMNQNGTAMRFKISQSQVSHGTSGHLRDEVGRRVYRRDKPIHNPMQLQGNRIIFKNVHVTSCTPQTFGVYDIQTVCLSDEILWQSQSDHCCALCNVKNHSNAHAFVTRDWITSKNCDSISCRRWFDVTNYVTSIGCRAALCSSQFPNLRRNNWTQLNFICKSHNN